MAQIVTMADLQSALTAAGVAGVKLSFGPSASPLRQGQWFATMIVGDTSKQVRADTLAEALNELLGSTKPSSTSLAGLLV